MRAGPVCLLGLLWASAACAQLAITEVLPFSKMNTNTLFHGAEFWEMTNFGTNDIDLNGYGFRDSDYLDPVRKYPFNNLTIRASESVIFFRVEPNNPLVVTPEHFKAWWGASNLPAQLQIRTYEKPGLSAWDGDEVWVFDEAGNVVDTVRFDSTNPGFSFTYDANTGVFGVPSANGMNGAFTAALTPDIGSPGATAGPVPVNFLVQPADIEADGGMTVTFKVRAGGVPPPKYQWLFKNLLLPGATNSWLTLPNLQPSQAGAYRVVISNGLSSATSAPANLTVNTNPTAPRIISAPADATVFFGQTAAFTLSVRGYPPPSHRWQTNGVDIPGAVGPILELANVGAYLNGAAVSVIVSNAVGTTSASAVLTVTRWPDLAFTEVMAMPANFEANRHFGWVELSNFDTNTIDLLGWRFAEEYSFARAVTITNSIRLGPGESLVIAERLDRSRFGAWWGARALPEDVKLYTYRGFGLETDGGEFFLWNAAARNPFAEVVATLIWAGSTPGVSYECEYTCDNGCLSQPQILSALGVRGAFASGDGLDIGSPGYTDAPALKIVAITREPPGQVALTCKVVAGRRYQLWRSASLASPDWSAVQTIIAENNLITFSDDASAASSFYRVQEIP